MWAKQNYLIYNERQLNYKKEIKGKSNDNNCSCHLYVNHRDYIMMLKNHENKSNTHACFTDAP